MKVVLAVSGGIDSMVLLDVMAKKYSSGDIIVAHFNHGIRDNSDKDAEFVKNICEKIYHVTVFIGNGELGAGTSEEQAREARYAFLEQVAAKNGGAKIYTAHHLDDLIETIAINFLRGTGWRGLAGLDRSNVRRPFLETEMFYEPMDKSAIMEYAAKRGLTWREDQTNSSDVYLRNRVREKFAEVDMDYDQKMRIWKLWCAQKNLKQIIEQVITEIAPQRGEAWPRKQFQEMDANVALELLRFGTMRADIRATRPQLKNLRQAILNYQPGKYFNLPGDNLVKINKSDFMIAS